MTDAQQLTRIFVSHTLKLAGAFPRGNAPLKDQLTRATTSVYLNLAEGLGQFSSGDKRRAYSIAMGELREARAALEIAEMSRLVTASQRKFVDDMADRIAAMLFRLVRFHQRA